MGNASVKAHHGHTRSNSHTHHSHCTHKRNKRSHRQRHRRNKYSGGVNSPLGPNKETPKPLSKKESRRSKKIKRQRAEGTMHDQLVRTLAIKEHELVMDQQYEEEQAAKAKKQSKGRRRSL